MKQTAMTFRYALACGLLLGLLVGTPAVAQTRPVFDPDDFLDPRQHDDMPVFASRLVIGGAWNFIDDYRPADQNVGFVHVTNSFYFRRVEFDYKHSEILGDNPPVHACACDPPIYYPTPPPPDATPDAPPPGSRDALQAAWYISAGGGRGRIPVMLRYRLTWSRHTFEIPVTQPQTDQVLSHRTGREQTFGLDGDIYLPPLGRYGFGSFQYARSSRKGPTDNRTQQDLVYTSRIPGTEWKGVLFRATLSVGAVSDRDGTAINLVHPYFEAFFHEPATRVNFHLVWSPQIANSGLDGWKTTHQIAVFADWGKIWMLRRR